MDEMAGIERIGNILKRKPVDRIGLFEHFWGDTQQKWTSDGHLKEGESFTDHFGFDMDSCWPFNSVAQLDFEEQLIEEDEDTRLVLDGNGATLRRHKHHDTTPEHVDFYVRDRATWEEYKPFLTPSRERINFEAYRDAKRICAEKNRFFCWSGVNVFEQMHPIAGHEYMLMGMAMDPDWIHDMVDTYSNLTVNLMEILFAEEGEPDGIWFYEDMGFKNRPFLSPGMYKEIVQPAHIKTIRDFAHGRNIPVIMHSCGFVEPLVPGIIEAGVDCLQVIEIKAGMDLLRLYKEYGDHLSFCGGMDSRNLVANDIDAIRAELNEKIPVVKENFGYILHSDHSIPTTTDYETYRFFIEEGMKLGHYNTVPV